jgi:uncharacterized protein with PIN domain
MNGSYTREQRSMLEAALKQEQQPLRCPECGGEVRSQIVAPSPEVSYVRRRVWLLCTQCRRSASVDSD